MVHRQEGKVAGGPVPRPPRQQRGQAFGHPAQLLVVEDDPLGPARGARGVTQRGQVAEANRRRPDRFLEPATALRAGPVRSPQGQESLPGHDAVVRGTARGRRRRSAGPALSSPSRSSSFGAPMKSSRAPLACEDRVHVGGRAGVVERHAHRAGQADGHVEGEVARAVQPDDGDAVAAPDAQRAQRVRRARAYRAAPRRRSG